MYVKPQFDARFAEGVAYFKRMLRLLSGDSVAFEFVGCSGGGRIGWIWRDGWNSKCEDRLYKRRAENLN